MKSVVVTGTSSGIGWGTAKVLIQEGVQVFGSVRNEQDANRLQSEFGDLFTPLLFDVTDEAAVAQAADTVRAALKGSTLLGLVNNAGIAAPGPLLHQPVEEMREVIEVNLLGQMIVTQAFGPLLGADRSLKGDPGRIVMISSVGGKIGSPFLGIYAASKHALEGISESLRKELMPFGIDVIVIGPGAVATEIWGKSDQIDITRYANTEYGETLAFVREFMKEHSGEGLPPETLGKAIWHALSDASPKTRYAIVPNKFMNWTLLRLLPPRLIDQLTAKRFGLR